MKAVSGKDLCKVLERHGWTRQRIKSSHHIYSRPDRTDIVSVPVNGGDRQVLVTGAMGPQGLSPDGKHFSFITYEDQEMRLWVADMGGRNRRLVKVVKHPVRFGYSAGHKIIDHDAEVSIGPVEDDGIGLAGRQRGIQTGNKSLRCGLFIARGAIDLTSQE